MEINQFHKENRDLLKEVNFNLAKLTSTYFVTVSQAFLKVSQFLATYNILLPQWNFSDPSLGEKLFVVRKANTIVGQNIDGTFDDSPIDNKDDILYFYFSYSMTASGYIEVFAQLTTDDEELSALVYDLSLIEGKVMRKCQFQGCSEQATGKLHGHWYCDYHLDNAERFNKDMKESRYSSVTEGILSKLFGKKKKEDDSPPPRPKTVPNHKNTTFLPEPENPSKNYDADKSRIYNRYKTKEDRHKSDVYKDFWEQKRRTKINNLKRRNSS